MGNQRLTPISHAFDSEIDHISMNNYLKNRVTLTGIEDDDTERVFKESESLISFEKLSEKVSHDVLMSLESYINKNQLYLVNFYSLFTSILNNI